MSSQEADGCKFRLAVLGTWFDSSCVQEQPQNTPRLSLLTLRPNGPCINDQNHLGKPSWQSVELEGAHSETLSTSTSRSYASLHALAMGSGVSRNLALPHIVLDKQVECRVLCVYVGGFPEEEGGCTFRRCLDQVVVSLRAWLP